MAALATKVVQHLFSIKGLREDWRDTCKLLDRKLPDYLHWKTFHEPKSHTDFLGQTLHAEEKLHKGRLAKSIFLGVGPFSTGLVVTDVYFARVIPASRNPHEAVLLTTFAVTSNLLLARKTLFFSSFAGRAVRTLGTLRGDRHPTPGARIS